MEKSQNTSVNNLIILGIVLLGLYFGKNLIIPFVIAVVIWYLINSLKRLVSKIKIGGKQLPRVVQKLISVVMLGSIFFFVGELVYVNFKEFVKVYPSYHASILGFSENIQNTYDIPISTKSLAENLDIKQILGGALNSSLGFISTIFLVILYVIFLSMEESIFGKKLKQLFNDNKRYANFLSTLKEVDESINTYVSVKTGLCLLVAVSSYVVLYFLDIDFAILWAFVIFILNYIPIVGPIIGIGFPAIIALLQFSGDFLPGILVVTILFSIQTLVGNFIEPKVLGDKLNLSPLVVIIALVFWGALWGIAGMVLCVPITVILMIVFRQFDSTKNVAILLSGGK